MLATAGSDGLLVIHTLHPLRQVEIRDATYINHIAFSETGLLATVGDCTRIYEHGTLVAEIDVGGNNVSFAPGAQFLLVDNVVLRCYKHVWQWEIFIHVPGQCSTSHWGRTGLIAIAHDSELKIWSLVCGKLQCVATLSDDVAMEKVEWDLSGMSVCTTHKDGIRIWSTCYTDNQCQWALRDVIRDSERETMDSAS